MKADVVRYKPTHNSPCYFVGVRVLLDNNGILIIPSYYHEGFSVKFTSGLPYDETIEKVGEMEVSDEFEKAVRKALEASEEIQSLSLPVWESANALNNRLRYTD